MRTEYDEGKKVRDGSIMHSAPYGICFYILPNYWRKNDV